MGPHGLAQRPNPLRRRHRLLPGLDAAGRVVAPGLEVAFDELRELWPKKCKSMGFYDYYSVWLWDFDKLPGGALTEADYRKSAQEGGFAGNIVVGTDLVSIRLPSK